MTIYGIDVSAAQGVIPDVQWQAIAQDKQFAYIESQVGNDGSNPQFDNYLRGATAAGMVVGAYICAACLPNDNVHPNRDPEGQMQLFFESAHGLGGNAGELAPCIDLEDPAPERWAADGVTPTFLEDWTGRAIDRVKTLFGREPVIYGYPFWFQLARLQKVGECKLWLAAYGGSKARTAPPWTPGLATILQVSNGGYRLPNGNPCDEDEIASAADFALLRFASPEGPA